MRTPAQGSPFTGGDRTPPFLTLVASGGVIVDDKRPNDLPSIGRAGIPASETPNLSVVPMIANVMPVNATMAAAGPLPEPIRGLAKIIAAIRWFPIGWRLFCSIPSEARQSWTEAFGTSKE